MRLSVRLCFAALLIAFGSAAVAQDYPSRVVTIIVPYPAGARPTSWRACSRRNSPISSGRTSSSRTSAAAAPTIADRPGRARDAQDGHTLLLHNLQISANVALYPKLTFDTEKDLTPVAFINQNPLVLVGRKSLAAEHAAGAGRLDEDDAAADGASRHRLDRPPRHLAARPGGEGRGRARSLSRRGAGAAGHRSAGMSICSSPRRSRWCRQVAGRPDEGVRHHRRRTTSPQFPKVASFVRCTRAEARDSLLARPVRAGRDAAGRSSTSSAPWCSAVLDDPGDHQGLGRDRRGAVRQGPALAAGGAGADAERDRALEPGRAREQHPAVGVNRRALEKWTTQQDSNLPRFPASQTGALFPLSYGWKWC